MRVISGTAKGRKLSVPVGDDIKPTSDMVKESIFNIVQFDIEGRKVLDLFAGTGQIGIEALSRGAKSAVFVDASSEAIKLIHSNIKKTGFEHNATVYRKEALRYLANDEKFDLIFLDPPYNTILAEKSIEKIIEFDKLNTNGIIIAETSISAMQISVDAPYQIQKEYLYGNVKITRIIKE